MKRTQWSGCGWARVVVAVMVCAVVMVGCEKKAPPAPAGPRQVVVYCSADAPVAQPVFDEFEKRTGIKVKAVFDTEATKTTGLVNRVLSEHESHAGQSGGGADVWWSSEPFGTIRLARSGALAKYISGPAESDYSNVAGGSWPRELRGRDDLWYGFARRVRVVIYNTKFVKDEDVPRELKDLTNEKFKGRVGMARPEFGTTRGHMAAIRTLGENVLKNWIEGMATNQVRLFEGNASVARSVGNGEIWVGLTDSDDALQAQANGWPVGFVVVSNVPEKEWHRRAFGVSGPDQEAFPEGSMQIPNTVALLRDAPHPGEGGLLIDFLLTRECERMLEAGEGKNLPTPRGEEMDQAAKLARKAKPETGPFAGQRWRLSELNLERAADWMDSAMEICGEGMKGR